MSTNYQRPKNPAEAVTRRCSVKKLFLKISQNSQESTCVRAFTLNVWECSEYASVWLHKLFLVFYPQINNNHASTFCKCKSNPFRKFSHWKNPFFISKNIWKTLGKEVLQSRFFVNLWTYGLQISKNYFPWRMFRSSHPEVFLGKGVIYRRTPMPKYDFTKVAKQLYWNHTLARVFPCKFAAYF